MKEQLVAINIKLQSVESKGVAYYRLDEHFKEFLSTCEEEHGIVGFEFEEGSFNFGVILGNKSEKGGNNDVHVHQTDPQVGKGNTKGHEKS